eukprot:PhM_4_TR2779/c0_g1_i1/m.33207/K06269/PPP1C; serine/threonine-protein phosphatase PP1 catalytic subunit
MEDDIHWLYETNPRLTTEMVLLQSTRWDNNKPNVDNDSDEIVFIILPFDVLIDIIEDVVLTQSTRYYPHALRLLDDLVPIVFNNNNNNVSDSEPALEQINKAFGAIIDEKIKEDMTLVLADVAEVLLSEPPVLSIECALSPSSSSSSSSPITIVGQFGGEPATLAHLFKSHNLFSIHHNDGRMSVNSISFRRGFRMRFVFLGDYSSGRGEASLITTLILYCLKLLFPCEIFLLRGQKECTCMARVYGLYDQCRRLFGEKNYAEWRSKHKAWPFLNLCDVFNRTPLMAVVGQSFLCVPSGIAPEMMSNKDHHLSPVQRLQRRVSEDYNRPMDVPERGLVMGVACNTFDPTFDDLFDSVGRCALNLVYGRKAVKRLCEEYGLEAIVCSPNVIEQGHNVDCDGSYIELFSVPNYCGEYNNKASVLHCRSQYRECLAFVESAG